MLSPEQVKEILPELDYGDRWLVEWSHNDQFPDCILKLQSGEIIKYFSWKEFGWRTKVEYPISFWCVGDIAFFDPESEASLVQAARQVLTNRAKRNQRNNWLKEVNNV